MIASEEKLRRESPKRTISASGGLEPLQMVSKPDTERYASEEAKLRRRWIGVPRQLEKEASASEYAEPRRGWIVRSHIRLERGTKHSLQGCRNLSLANTF